MNPLRFSRSQYVKTVIGGALLLSSGIWPIMARALPIRPLPTAYAAVSTGISVQGHADLKVKPDMASITVGVTTQSAQESEAAASNAKITTAVLAALRNAGVADIDLNTSDYSIDPQYNYQVSPSVLTGYQVSNTINVAIHRLASAGAIIDAASKAGATNVSGLSFDLTDRTAAEQQALKLAVANASAKAQAMAQAAGVSLGPLLSLSEGSPTVVQPFVMRSMVAMAAPAPTTPIQGNQLTITADVSAVYAIGMQ